MDAARHPDGQPIAMDRDTDCSLHWHRTSLRASPGHVEERAENARYGDDRRDRQGLRRDDAASPLERVNGELKRRASASASMPTTRERRSPGTWKPLPDWRQSAARAADDRSLNTRRLAENTVTTRALHAPRARTRPGVVPALALRTRAPARSDATGVDGMPAWDPREGIARCR